MSLGGVGCSGQLGMVWFEFVGVVEDLGSVGGVIEGVVVMGESEECVDIVVDLGGGFFEVR